MRMSLEKKMFEIYSLKTYIVGKRKSGVLGGTHFTDMFS